MRHFPFTLFPSLNPLNVLRSVVVLLASLAIASSAAAQKYVFPGRSALTPTICTTCLGQNAGLPTYQYDRPIFAHAGRYVDSTTTGNIQNVGMRTVRARQIRVNPARNRVYVALGEAIGAYDLDTFFTTHLRKPMDTMKSLQFTSTIGGRDPLEAVSLPQQYFYAESSLSGWSYSFQDAQEILTDFDTDDRGHVYIGTHYFGWGISHDAGLTDRGHFGYRFQAQPSIRPLVVFAFRKGDTYYAVIAESVRSAGAHVIFDVTNPEVPVEIATREKNADKQHDDKYGIVAWSKHESSERLALLNTDGHVRIYDYTLFLADGEPLADYTPAAGKKFAGISFDEDGRVWIAETADNAITTNVLHRATPAGGSYTKTTFDVYGSAFAPDAITAGGGFVAVSGRSTLDGSAEPGDMRLLRITNGEPALVPDGGFFRRYYAVPPAGYADPGTYTALHSMRLLEQGSKTYLMYSARGLGDVYELDRTAGNRIDTSISLRTENAGTTVNVIATVTAASMGTASLTGVVTFTKNGEPLTTASVSGTADPLTYIVNLPRTDLLTAATLAATYEGDALYAPSGPASFQYAPATIATPAHFSALATGTNAVQLTWDALNSVDHYEIWRKDGSDDFAPLATTPNAAFVDTTVVPDTLYLYRVRGVGTSPGPFSATEIATTMVFTDDPLTTGIPLKAAHITELRTAVNALRVAAGLSEYSFTDPFITTGTLIRALHSDELHDACDGARSALGLGNTATAPTFSRDDVLALRSAVQ